MVKLDTQSVPSEFETLYGQSLVNRDIRGIENAGRKTFQDSRKILGQLEEKSLISEVAVAWGLLSDIQKVAWNDAAEYWSGERNGYSLFVQDYIARQKRSLSLPGVPNNTYQTFGLKFRRDFVDTGQVLLNKNFSEISNVNVFFKYCGVADNPLDTIWFRIRVNWYGQTGGVFGWKFTYFTFYPLDSNWSEDTFYADSPEVGYYFFGFNFYSFSYPNVVYIDNLLVQSGAVEIFFENFSPRYDDSSLSFNSRAPLYWKDFDLNNPYYVDIVYLDS